MAAWTNFMTGFGYDHRYRNLETILNYNDEQLEERHDYIQWLFPLNEPSIFNLKAPTLTDWDIRYVRNNRNNIKKNIKRAFKMMLYFWGFTMYDFGVFVYIKHDGRRSHWMYPDDHNHLRMSRVIHFLRSVGMEKYAKAFHASLRDIYTERPDFFSANTIKYWEKIMP